MFAYNSSNLHQSNLQAKKFSYAFSTQRRQSLNMLIEFIYISDATKEYTWAELDTLRKEAATRNKLEKITGMLLFDGRHFMQVLEGEELKVQALFNKIKKDARHCNVEPLIQNPINKRNFNSWAMGLITCDNDTQLQQFTEMGEGKKQPLSVKLLQSFARKEITIDERIS